MTAVAFVVAAAAGALGRHLVVAGVGRGGPDRGRLGVLAVNVVGSLVLGVLVGLRLDGSLSAAALTVLGGGFCGALTTWSGFAVDAATAGRPAPTRSTAPPAAAPRSAGAAPAPVRTAGCYLAASLALGLAAAGVGLALTGAL